MKLFHKGLLLISVPLAFEIVFAFGFSSLLKRSMNQLQAEVHARDVIARAERLHVLISEACVLVGLKFKHKSPELQQRYASIWKDADQNYLVLKKLTSKKKYAQVRRELAYTRAFLRMMLQAVWADNTGGLALPGIGEQIKAQFGDAYKDREARKENSAVGKLIRMELSSVRQGPRLHAEISDSFSKFLVLGVCGDILLVLGLALFFGQSIERRLRSLMETTRRLSKGDELAPPLNGNDELANLDLLLHYTASSIIEMQKFKRQLLGVVCHELKAPLSAVQILLALVAEEKDELEPKARSALQRASRSCNRLQLMVTELLDLESMNAEKIKLKKIPTRPLELLESAAEMVAAIAKDQNIALVIDACQAEVPLDPDRMGQVLVNLLSNAIKFSPKGSEVGLRACEHADQIEFSVIDHGPGIPEELHESLFELFSQGEQPKDLIIKGTGMGLAISKAIVEAHGGTIKIISSPGQGARFQILIPKQAVVVKLENTEVSTATLSKKQFRIRHKGMLLICLPLLAEMLLLGSLAYFLQEANSQLQKQSQARKVISESQQVVEAAADSAVIQFFGGEGPERELYYQEEESRIHARLDSLMKSCAGDPKRLESGKNIVAAVERINELHHQFLEEGRKRELTTENVDPNLIKAYLDAWEKLSEVVNTLTAFEESAESKDAAALSSIARNLDQLIVLGLSVNILSALGLTIFLTQNIGKRIVRVHQNAERILKKEELLPPVTGSDEIAELDKAFHDAAFSLQQEHQIKQKLLAIASHELRSPLSAILISLNVLIAGAVGTISQKNSQRLSQAEAGTRRLIALINDILDIEKMEAGKFELSIEDLHFQNVNERAIACVQALAEKKNISIENRCDDKLVRADAERLTQVLINLLSNAIKFSSQGQAIRIASQESRNGELIITIEDSGRGISPDLQERIFEQFVSSSGDDNPEGTGLGLSICKAIIEEHGGSIGCESEEGKGSRFWFSLPLAK
ncbi:MAG: HAMP domain-containing histidine kinase [Candidatus Obscuribacterales bacterium]|nr:HAMP domain-containing histidine kinase [Candidatus Obscuribacterales bacterium]